MIEILGNLKKYIKFKTVPYKGTVGLVPNLDNSFLWHSDLRHYILLAGLPEFFIGLKTLFVLYENPVLYGVTEDTTKVP